MKKNLLFVLLMSISLELSLFNAGKLVGMELTIREQKQEDDEGSDDSSDNEAGNEDEDSDTEEAEYIEALFAAPSQASSQVTHKTRIYTKALAVGLVITTDDNDIEGILDIYVKNLVTQFILYVNTSASYARALQVKEYLESNGIKDVVLINEPDSSLIDAYNELLLSASEQFKSTRFLLIAHSSWQPCKLDKLIQFCQNHMNRNGTENHGLTLRTLDHVEFQIPFLLDTYTLAYFTDELEECAHQILDPDNMPRTNVLDIATHFIEQSQQRLSVPQLRHLLMRGYGNMFLFYP